MTEIPKKYKIDDCLSQLTVKEYRMAVHIIPKILGVSLNTFHNYRNISVHDMQDIPYEKVLALEKLFGLKPGELINRSIRVGRLRDLLKRADSIKAKQDKSKRSR